MATCEISRICEWRKTEESKVVSIKFLRRIRLQDIPQADSIWYGTMFRMRIIVHLDMDAFFAAVEERYNPQFRGKPIVIGADPKDGRGRGVVSTANYPARKYGIRSALPISQAWRLAEAAKERGEPGTIFLEGNYHLYQEVSERIMAIAAKSTDAFEQARPPKFLAGNFERAGIDEAYLEWKFESRSSKSESAAWRKAERRARKIKQEVLEYEGLTCSIGIGPNKLIAKIASDFQKPDGLTIVRSDNVEAFLKPLPIRAIPGIGPKTEAALHNHGIRTIGELCEMPRGELTRTFGSWGDDLYDKARGVNDSPVSNDWEAKSIGEQETFEEDTREAAFILDRAHALAHTVFCRFHQDGFRSFRTVVLTVRFADFSTTTRSRTHPTPLTTEAALDGATLRLLLPFLDTRENPMKKKIRLIGIRAEKIL